MKNLKISNFGSVFLLFTSLWAVSSCSWIATDRSSVGEGEGGEININDLPEMVSREDFIKVYQENQELKAKLSAGQNPNPATIEMNSMPTTDPEGEVKPLVVETESAVVDDGTLSSAVQRLQQAIRWAQEGKGPEALKVFQDLERFPSKQIKVHARFQTALLFFSQKEFDLALQSFEAIIQQYAFSGLVIKSVEFGVICAEKLGLLEKQQQYISILRDVFKVSA